MIARTDLNSDEVADHLSEGFRDESELLGQGLDDQPHILQPDRTTATSSSRYSRPAPVLAATTALPAAAQHSTGSLGELACAQDILPQCAR